MSLRTDLPDFYTLTKQHNEAMSAAELAAVMESGRKWDLAQVLKDRGAIIFPHFNYSGPRKLDTKKAKSQVEFKAK